MSIRMHNEIQALRGRIERLERVAEAAESDLREGMQGELFAAERIELTHLRILFGLKVPEPTALPAPNEEETPFDS